MSVTFTRFGTDAALGGSATVLDLFYKIFGGEVYTAFERLCVTKGRHWTKTITNGKSAAFPLVGTAKAGWFVPGNEINTNQGGTTGKIKHTEKVISIDSMLIASDMLYLIDELMSNYDARSIHVTEIARALANAHDQHVLACGIAAARTTGSALGTKRDGTIVTESAVDTDGEAAISALFQAAKAFRSKDVPMDGAVAYMTQTVYDNIVQSTKGMNRDWGGTGSIATGEVPRIAGFELIPTNNFGVVDAVVDSDGDADQSGVATGNDVFGASGVGYKGLFNTSAILCTTPPAVGTVQLLGLTLESEYQMRHQGHLIIAKYACGHGIVRPECAVEIRSGSPSA